MVHLLDRSSIDKEDTATLCSFLLGLFSKSPNLDADLIISILDLLRFRLRADSETNRAIILEKIPIEQLFQYFIMPGDTMIDALSQLTSSLISPFSSEMILSCELFLISGLSHPVPSVPELIFSQLSKLRPEQWTFPLITATIETLFHPSLRVFQALKPLFQSSSLWPLFFQEKNEDLFLKVTKHSIAKYRLLELVLYILPEFSISIPGLFLPIPEGELDLAVYLELLSDAAFHSLRIASCLDFLIDPIMHHSKESPEPCLTFLCSMVTTHPQCWDLMFSILEYTSVQASCKSLLKIPPSTVFPEKLVSILSKVSKDAHLRLSLLQPQSYHVLEVFGVSTLETLINEFCTYLKDPFLQKSVFKNFELLSNMPLFEDKILEKVEWILDFPLQGSEALYSRYQFIDHISQVFKQKLNKDVLFQIDTFLRKGIQGPTAMVDALPEATR